MTKGCGSCLYLNKANCNIYYEPCLNCQDNSEYVPTTNGDRLRAMHVMDNHELAELLSDIQKQSRKPPWDWIKWLEETVEVSE